MFSCNAVLDAINVPIRTHTHRRKTLILADNITAHSWIRKMDTSSLTGKNLNSLFSSLLMNQKLGLDSAYLPGRENQVANKHHA